MTEVVAALGIVSIAVFAPTGADTTALVVVSSGVFVGTGAASDLQGKQFVIVSIAESLHDEVSGATADSLFPTEAAVVASPVVASAAVVVANGLYSITAPGNLSSSAGMETVVATNAVAVTAAVAATNAVAAVAFVSVAFGGSDSS